MSRTLSLLSIVAIAVAAVTACSDEEPPEWLQDVADDQVAVPTTAGPPTTTPTAPTTTADPATDAAELGEGQCLVEIDLEGGADLSEAVTTPCRGDHQAEIFALIEIDRGPRADFPGGGALTERAETACRERFDGFVGISWTQSVLDFASLRPTRASWEDGDRGIACVLFKPNGKDLTGTARDTKR